MTGGRGAAAARRVRALLDQRGDVDPDLVLEAWEVAFAEPAVSPQARALAPDVVRALRRRASHLSAPPAAPAVRARARTLADRARRVSRSDLLRADLRAEGLLARLDDGEPVDVAELHRQLEPVLAATDVALAASDGAGRDVVARLLTAVLGGLLHRCLHNEDLDSPLVDPGPDAYLAPLRASAAYRMLVSPGRSPRPDGSGRQERREPPTVVLVTAGNQNFTRSITARVDACGGRLERLDLSRPPDGVRPPPLADLVADRFAQAAGERPGRTAPRPGSAAAELLARADVVVVDWALEHAAWASLHVPASVRLVVRLHRIEAFSAAAHVVDWSRVDALVVVAPHMATLARRALDLPDDLPVHVVPVLGQPSVPATGPAPTSAARTVALVGGAVALKDAGWALDVVDRLRRDDPAWRLLVIGAGPADRLTARGWTYRAALEERLAESSARGAAVLTGHVDDVPTVVREAGVVLSASRHEGCHVGFLEAVASGCLPVARDWPLARPFGGAAGLLPAHWLVTDPGAAAERILSAACSGRIAAEGAAAAAELAALHPRSAVDAELDLALGL